MPSGNARGQSVKSRAPQRRRGRERVASLQAAAAALFVEKGYDATTMTEIAARAGASIGSLYLFFPTKHSLAEAMLMELAETLSTRLVALKERVGGRKAVEVGDALFDELADFTHRYPAYGVLIDLSGEYSWRLGLRARRRAQIAALFQEAEPALPREQAEHLAVIVPQLLRMGLLVSGRPDAEGVMTELRAMLRHHLERSE
ncbi:MAG: TetR/AcrR family transcriptional regulator [Rhizobiaceae bacterium]|nr:MAG: TetR/AcrR family transcriptional regulator [Rhizobiaceae bacterium]